MASPAASLSLLSLATGLRELVFPSACGACGAPVAAGALFCGPCESLIEPLPASRCPLCGRPGPAAACPACAEAKPAYDAAWALARHSGPLAQAVRAFKYQRRYWLGPALARLLATAPRNGAAAELIAPVPLHPRRLLRRGFNQAAVLARGLAGQTGVRLAPQLLRRLRHTRPQVGLDPAARRANVAGAFGLGRGWAGRLDGAAVLLIDDVFTTGATVAECAQVLKQAGAAWVEVLTLVRAGGGNHEAG